MPTLAKIRGLGEREPVLAPSPASGFEASVALVFNGQDAAAPELLFIQRAIREGDPWSGHMAFPGGRRDAADGSEAATAARETLEEVGLDLAHPIAQLDDFAGSGNPRVPPLRISPFVYEVNGRPELRLNHEVQSVVWVPVPWMLSPTSVTRYEVERDGAKQSFPAFVYSDYVVWGLTYRILTGFFDLLGSGLPDQT